MRTQLPKLALTATFGKLFFLLPFLAIVAHGQQTSIAVLPSDGTALNPNELEALTDEMREAALKILPTSAFVLLKQDVVVKRLGGAENFIKECKESTCIVNLGKKAQVDYVTQASVFKLGNSIRLKVELYDVRTEGLVSMFNDEAENVRGLLAAVKNRAPEIFGKISGVSGGGGQTQPTAPTKTEPAIQGTIVPGGSLAQKLVWLQKSADSHETYILDVNADENIAPYTFEFRGGIDITVILRGVGGNRIIKLQSHGTMFTVKKDVTFILDNNITIQGHNGNTGSMVKIEGGEFKMNIGSYIIGNTTGAWGGGGVLVDGKGIFTMTGGTISGNKIQWGGGVHVVSGTFTMNGGTISGNTATEAGGGVYLNGGEAIFVMSGGTIVGNFARRNGGGIQTWHATFTMRGGIISGNTAGEMGGGVWIDPNTSFTKTSGTITGYKNDFTNGNVVKDEGGSILARKGHAVYRGENQRKETTAGPGVNFSCNNNSCTGGWDE